MSESKLFFAGLMALLFAGFFIPFWPLAALCVGAGAIAGRPIFAIGAGLLADLLWGAPPGIFEMLTLPFSLLALGCLGVHFLGKRYFFPKSRPMRLY